MVIRSVDVKLESVLTIVGWSTLSSQGQPNMSEDTTTISNDDRNCLLFIISSPFGSSELLEVNPSLSAPAFTKSIHFQFVTSSMKDFWFPLPIAVLGPKTSGHWACVIPSGVEGRNVLIHTGYSAGFDKLNLRRLRLPLPSLSKCRSPQNKTVSSNQIELNHPKTVLSAPQALLH